MSNSISSNSYASALFLDRTQSLLGQSIDRLSSGTNNIESTDANAVSVTAKLSGQDARIQAANTNVQNATSYLQAANGFASNITDVLSRMSELAMLVQDPTKAPSDVADYATEFTQLQTQLRDTVGGTTSQIGGSFDINSPMGSFNGEAIFGSNAATSVQVGPDGTDKLSLPSMNLQTGAMLSLIQQDSAGNFTLSATSATALKVVSQTDDQVSTIDASIGGASASLDRASQKLTAQSQSVEGTISGIQDVDVAAETTRLAKYQILTQATTAMMAQQQQDPKAILNVLNSIHGK